jgi:hypothetical protein
VPVIRDNPGKNTNLIIINTRIMETSHESHVSLFKYSQTLFRIFSFLAAALDSMI